MPGADMDKAVKFNEWIKGDMKDTFEEYYKENK
jgi:hypothetical protein